MIRKNVAKRKTETRNYTKGLRRYAEANGPRRMLLAIFLVILIIFALITQPTRVPETPDSVVPTKRVDPVVLEVKQESLVGFLQQSPNSAPKRVDPVVHEYTQGSLVGFLQQSPSSVPGRVDPVVLEYRKENLVKALQQSIMGHHNVLCGDLAELEKKSRENLPSSPDFPLLMSFRINCEDLFAHNIYGTGNVLLMFYNIRLIARLLGNVQVEMQCPDAVATRSSLVIPWLMGSFAATPWPGGATPSLEDACESFQPKTAHVIVDDIKYELRRMALSLVGVPSKNHPAERFVQDETRERSLQVPMSTSPLLSDVEIDDVAIHFRCGDIIELKAHHKYRYARWSSLAKRISPEARSIGIVTQPIKGQTRPFDKAREGRCLQLLGPMQAYFQKEFPEAKVSLRNAPDETIALAFSRFIMANQSLAGGFSTFYTMPFYATFGTAYEIDEGDNMVSSENMMALWRTENGLQQILSLFTSGGD